MSIRPARHATPMHPDELTEQEADALVQADEIDSGDLAERLIDLAEIAAYHNPTPHQLRNLAAIALTLARRLEQPS